MILLQVKSLAKSFGVKEIFSDINFIIQTGDKIGLIGPNGAGKTTLFRCITGEEQADSVEVLISDSLSLGYLRQLPDYPAGTTLMQAIMDSFADIFILRDKMRQMELNMGLQTGSELERTMEAYSKATEEYEKAGGFECETLARRVTHGLGFSREELEREVNEFSGGEKTRAGLARLLVREPDILLLDEPTNHLDLEAVEWLESYLKNYRGNVLLISHDRYFLDETTNRTLELEHGRLAEYNGNYSRYLVLKEEKILSQTRAYEKQQKEIRETEEYINKYRAGIKSKQARGRQSQLDRLERIEGVKTSTGLKLNSALHKVESSGNMVVSVKELGFGYGERKLLKLLNFEVYSGEKVALVGGNGTGKSTILKLIVGELTPEQGIVQFGSRVKVGYYDQEHKGLDANKEVIEELTYNFGMPEAEARNYLGTFLFRGDDVFKPVKSLSGGEKGRLSLLKLLLEKPNFLILDEPTNHLDIVSRGVVEDFLQNFEGTVLTVSHDRYFLDMVVDRTLELEQGSLKDYPGNYTYYKEKKESLRRDEEYARAQAVKPVAVEKKAAAPKINKAKTRDQIAQLEKEIEKLEERMEELSGLLADPDVYQDGDGAKELVSEYKILEEKIPLVYEEWERLCELINA